MVEREIYDRPVHDSTLPGHCPGDIRNTTSQPAPDVTVQYIARLYDQECCQVDAQAGWPPC